MNEHDDRHLVDVADEKVSKLDAAAHIEQFFAKNTQRFIALIQTYADGEAEELFEELREDFWTHLPARQP